jgi:plasmid maintenance system antidote protein VapI
MFLLDLILMNHTAIATCVGLIPMDLESLVKGKATAGLALKLGVTPSDIEDFINGSATYGMTKRLGLGSASAATELANVFGREGAIGIVVGLLFPAK